MTSLFVFIFYLLFRLFHFNPIILFTLLFRYIYNIGIPLRTVKNHLLILLLSRWFEFIVIFIALLYFNILTFNSTLLFMLFDRFNHKFFNFLLLNSPLDFQLDNLIILPQLSIIGCDIGDLDRLYLSFIVFVELANLFLKYSIILFVHVQMIELRLHKLFFEVFQVKIWSIHAPYNNETEMNNDNNSENVPVSYFGSAWLFSLYHLYKEYDTPAEETKEALVY